MPASFLLNMGTGNKQYNNDSLTVLGYMVPLWLLDQSCLRKSCFSSDIKGLWIDLPVAAWVLWFWKDMYPVLHALMLDGLEMFSSCNLLWISVSPCSAIVLWHLLFMQPRHFAIAYYCLYTKKLLMRKSRVTAIECCTCISSVALVVKLSPTLKYHASIDEGL